MQPSGGGEGGDGGQEAPRGCRAASAGWLSLLPQSRDSWPTLGTARPETQLQATRLSPRGVPWSPGGLLAHVHPAPLQEGPPVTHSSPCTPG